MKLSCIGIFVCTLLVAVCGTSLVSTPAFGQSWPQWAQNPQHTGFLNVVGQSLNQNLANIVYDPLVPQETARSTRRTLATFSSSGTKSRWSL